MCSSLLTAARIKDMDMKVMFQSALGFPVVTMVAVRLLIFFVSLCTYCDVETTQNCGELPQISVATNSYEDVPGQSRFLRVGLTWMSVVGMAVAVGSSLGRAHPEGCTAPRLYQFILTLYLVADVCQETWQAQPLHSSAVITAYVCAACATCLLLRAFWVEYFALRRVTFPGHLACATALEIIFLTCGFSVLAYPYSRGVAGNIHTRMEYWGYISGCSLFAALEVAYAELNHMATIAESPGERSLLTQNRASNSDTPMFALQSLVYILLSCLFAVIFQVLVFPVARWWHLLDGSWNKLIVNAMSLSLCLTMAAAASIISKTKLPRLAVTLWIATWFCAGWQGTCNSLFFMQVRDCVHYADQPLPGAEPLVPKVVHRIWFRNPEVTSVYHNLPLHYNESIELWKDELPTYQHRVWHEPEIRHLIEKRYQSLLPTFDGYHLIQKIDAAKLVVLHTYGGLYADLDLLLLPGKGPQAIEELSRYPATFAAIDYGVHNVRRTGLSNDFIMSVPGNAFLEFLISRLPDYDEWYLNWHWTVIASTGPGFVSTACARSSQKGNMSVHVLDDGSKFLRNAGSFSWGAATELWFARMAGILVSDTTRQMLLGRTASYFQVLGWTERLYFGMLVYNLTCCWFLCIMMTRGISRVMGLDCVQRHQPSMEDAPESAENWYTTRAKMV